MSKHSQIAEENFKKGYNCAQAVVLAFQDVTGLDEEISLKLSSSFGGGMGRLREVCGAVTGMFIVAGVLYGYADPLDAQAKANHYLLIQKLAGMFSARHGTYICRELLDTGARVESHVPEARTDAYYQSRPCPRLVASAAEVLDAYIESVE